MTGVLIRERRGEAKDTEMGSTASKMEAETGGALTQAEDTRGHQKPEKISKDSSSEPPEGRVAL